MIRRLLADLLTMWDLWRADRFAREQAIHDLLSKPLARHQILRVGHVNLICTDHYCDIPKPHSPCWYETALAARRDRERAK